MLIGQWNIAAWRYVAAVGYVGIFTLQASNALLDDFGGGAIGPQGTIEPNPDLGDENGPEEFDLLRYKTNVWLPAIRSFPN